MDGSSTVRTHERLKGVGLGVYAPGDIARLLRIPPSTISNWLRGRKDRSPLWESQHSGWDGELILGFQDFVQVVVVRALRNAGYSPQRIRQAIEFAKTELGNERPFSTKDFKMDGKDILLNRDGRLVTASGKNQGQRVFREIVAPSLKPISYGPKSAELYSFDRGEVVLDPTRCFGAPILDQYSVPTSVIARSVAAEGSEKVTARYFDIPVKQVRAAVRFEEKLAA